MEAEHTDQKQRTHPWDNKPKVNIDYGTISAFSHISNHIPASDPPSWARRLVEGVGFEPDNE